MPKVSIVLPNYNYARYLDERIQSLLDQTYTDFELIILDDASTDNSLEVIEKYTADPRVRTKFYSENSGLPYKRWNDGADLAQGEYLLIAGADDSCHPTLLEKLVEKLDAHPSVGLAFSQSWGIDGEGNRTHSWKNHTDSLDKNRWANDFVDSGINELQYLLFTNTIPNASAVLMRREIFLKAGKFDSQFKIVADWFLWSNLLMISDITFVCEPLNYFRTHPNTVRAAATKDALNIIEEEYKILKYLLESIDLPRDLVNKALAQKLSGWIEALIQCQSNISGNRNRRIYHLAKAIDRHIEFHLIGKITDYSFKRFIRIFTKLTASSRGIA